MQTSREQRWPCSGRVNLIIDAEPWKLRLSSHAINLSRSGMCVRVADPKHLKSPSRINLLPLIREGYTYDLQLENEDPEARAQPTTAVLVRKQQTGDSYILGFRFQNAPGEINELVQNLAQIQAEKHLS